MLRVMDGAGDAHPDTPAFEEFGEVRYPLSGDGPGLPQDVWTHVEIRVPCPDALRVRPKDVRVRVKPRRVAIAFGPPGAAEVDVLAGALAGEVLCQDDGDFEWELRDVPADDRPGEESSAAAERAH